MGDPTQEVSEEMMEKAMLAKREGQQLMVDGFIEEASHKFTDAVLSNPASAMNYAARAGHTSLTTLSTAQPMLCTCCLRSLVVLVQRLPLVFVLVLVPTPTHLVVLGALGCYVQLSRPRAALRDCEQAIKLNPDNARAFKWRGFVSLRLNLLLFFDTQFVGGRFRPMKPRHNTQ